MFKDFTEEGRERARARAAQDWQELTDKDYDDGEGFNFRREYPTQTDYVDEWWQERYLD